MLNSYAMTDVGRARRTNQDYVFTCQEPIGNLPNLFIVADGMGGHQAGDFASSYSVKKFLDSVASSQQKRPFKVFEDAISYANRELIAKAQQNPQLRGMGTTMVAPLTSIISLFIRISSIFILYLYKLIAFL